MRNNTKMLTFNASIQQCTGSSRQNNQARKGNKWTGRKKTLFTNDMILYAENLNNPQENY